MLHTAIQVKLAIENAAKYASPIGVCITQHYKWQEEHDEGSSGDDDNATPAQRRRSGNKPKAASSATSAKKMNRQQLLTWLLSAGAKPIRQLNTQIADSLRKCGRSFWNGHFSRWQL